MKKNALMPLDYDYSVDEDVLPNPIKLSKKDIEQRIVSVAGRKFFDTGYALACPKCGCTSGISVREDVDKQLDWFLKFGCKHYESK